MRKVVRRPARLEGVAVPPGDKSISHRAVLLNSIAQGHATVSNFCVGDDRISMLRCLRGLGADIRRRSPTGDGESQDTFLVRGRGPQGLSEPEGVLNAGNSGTTMRLVSGLLAAQPFFSVITGDRSLRTRPMDRTVKPLTRMGARIMGRGDASLAPLAFRGGRLHGIDFTMPVASAQLKSCLLIAGLHATGRTTITEPASSRDHTERMLRAMGADIAGTGRTISVGPSTLRAIDVHVPGDISGAAFWLVAGCCPPNARVTVTGVGVNPSRTGVLDVLKAMGARIAVENARQDGGEEVADLIVETSELRATEIRGEIVPRVIDELPVLALAATFARGTTVIDDAAELRVKESDRIKATLAGLSRLGAHVEERPDGMVIHGGKRLAGAECEGYGDHRIAMTMGIAGLLADGETTVVGAEAASVSYPAFWDTLEALRGPG